MIVTCKQCKIEFKNFPSNERIFCSRKCRTVFSHIYEPCLTCKKPFKRYRHIGRKYCSVKCSNTISHNNKGCIIEQNGYICIYQPHHPFGKGNYVYEHRLIMEKNIGRFLKKKEVVHHINGNKKDNRIENLQLFASNAEHIKYHWEHTDVFYNRN